jgi:GH15 family glucan-1,4-alpha-glucosidase
VRERLLEDGARLQPAYTARGGGIPDERRLDLPGYPGGRDFVGNRVSSQFQLDVFGEALLLFAAAGTDGLESETWQAVELAAEAIAARRGKKDAGIWELDPDEWTHSRLICAAGLRAAAAMSGREEQRAGWTALADDLTREAEKRALHPSGRWQRSPGDDRLDAALLFPGIRGAIGASDPRTVATLRAVASELTEDGYVYRYRPDERPLGEAEGAFLLCGFLLSLAFAGQGDSVESARWFERTRAACGPPGLLSEEFDVQQRQLRGNLPQAFVHAMLVEAAFEQA